MITEIEVKNVDATKTMHMIALHLIAKGYRYIEPKQAGGIAARFKVSREQMQAAIILADRIRRQQQLFEKRPTFRVDGLVDISAPIDLGPAKRDEKTAADALEKAFQRFRAGKAAAQEAKDAAQRRRERKGENSLTAEGEAPEARQRANMS